MESTICYRGILRMCWVNGKENGNYYLKIVNASARPPRLAGLPTVGTCKYRYTGI